MAQHDYVIANGSGSAVRSDLNNALAAIVSQNSGASEPTTTYAYQFWADTTAGVLKIRNGANNAWITLRELDGTLTIEAGSASTPGLYFAGDANTGIYSPSADQIGIATGGTGRLVIDASGNVNIDSGTVYVDAANNRLGVGTTTPGAPLSIGNTQRFDFATTGQSINAYENNYYIWGIRSGSNDLELESDFGGNIIFRAQNHGTVSSPGTAAERARIDSSGRLLVGATTARINNAGSVPQMQVEGLGFAASSVSLTNNANDNAGCYIFLTKTRGASIGSNTIVQNGDVLGGLYFIGADGVDTQTAAAYIQCEVDGTPGADDMPGRLVLSTTADGASSPTERVRIDSSGNVTINGQGDLRFADSDNSNWVALQAPATVSSNVTFTLPATDGTANQALVTNGSGIWSFATISQSVKAWVNFDGTGTPSIRASFNVSSITDNGIGDYTVNFTNALADANYAFVAGFTNNSSGAIGDAVAQKPGTTRTTTAITIQAYSVTGVSNATVVDFPSVEIAVFR